MSGVRCPTRVLQRSFGRRCLVLALLGRLLCGYSESAAQVGPPAAAAAIAPTPAQEVRPEAASTDSLKLRFYGEVSLWLGHLSNGGGPMDLRWALGAAVARRRGLAGRLGLAVDWFHGDGDGAAIGPELQLGWKFDARTAVALRTSAARADVGYGGKKVFLLGPRLARGAVVAGVDGVVTRGYQDGYGILFGVGIGERPGRYVTGVSAIGGAIVGILFLAAFSQATTH